MIRVAAWVVFVVAVDQITKSIAVARLDRGEVVEIFGTWLRFDLTTNSGGSFSLFQGSTTLLAIGAIAATGYLVHLLRTTDDRLTVAALTLLLCGALGNLGDRIFRAPGPLRGEVVDFIRIPRWPTFNVADMAVTFGGVLLAITVVVSGRRHGRDDRDPIPEPDPTNGAIGDE
jgi:signal peptidase II